jgi:hypothetical protein
MVNGDRPQLPRAAAAKVVTDTAPTVPELDLQLKNTRGDAKKMAAEKRRQELYALLRKSSLCDADTCQEVCGWLADGLKAGAGSAVVVEALKKFSTGEKMAADKKNARRQEQRNKRKCAKPRTAYPSYLKKVHRSLMKRLIKWEAARDHLAPFISAGTVEGLVASPNGIDFSVDGDKWILHKATLVHLHCSLRIMGMGRDEATAAACATFPPSARMSSGSTLRRYLAEYFELKAFRETTKGKWVRKHIFGNAALMFAMKTWLKANEYKIITSKDDPEDRKYFIAQHAADHLNGLLEAHPRFKNDKTYAASTPIKKGIMATWLKVFFNKEWKPNKKGTANARHDQADAVAQREVYIFANKWREYNNLVWHHVPLTSLKKSAPHLHDLALLAKQTLHDLRCIKIWAGEHIHINGGREGGREGRKKKERGEKKGMYVHI